MIKFVCDRCKEDAKYWYSVCFNRILNPYCCNLCESCYNEVLNFAKGINVPDKDVNESESS